MPSSSAPKGDSGFLAVGSGVEEPTIMDMLAGVRATSPEERVWIAVIEQAWKDLTGVDAVHQQDARDWFNSQRQNCEGSLGWICNFLKLEASYFRRKVAEMQSAGKIAPGMFWNRNIMRRERHIVPEHRRCHAMSRNNRRCGKHRVGETLVCRFHEGSM